MDSRPLIDPSRIISHGPKRLKPMQGQRFDPETRTWRVKNPKKAPDPVDRRKVQERIAVESVKPLPPETKPMDLSNYRPLKTRVLLQIGDEIAAEKGILIPDLHRKNEESFRVLAIGEPNTEFAIGDRVYLDKSSHKKPVSLDGYPPAVLVKVRRVAAVLVDDSSTRATKSA